MSYENRFLFAYGTLKKEFGNPFAEKLRQASDFVCEGYFFGKMYRVSWYPGAVADAGSEEQVFGEIYRIHDPGMMAELDEYEDVLEDETTSLYLRKIIPVTTSTGETISCWTYLYNQSVAELEVIPGGHFTG